MEFVRKAFPTDLKDVQWAILEPLLARRKPGGRPREVDLREVLNRILSWNRSGCPWGMLPHDLLLGMTRAGRALHRQVSLAELDMAKFVTIDEPDPKEWIENRNRR